MKLLYILPEYPPHQGGGIITFYRHLLPEIASNGHQIRIIVGSAFSSASRGYKDGNITVEFLEEERVNANLCRFEAYNAVPELKRHLAAAWSAYEQAQAGIGYDLVETTDWGLLFVPWIIEAGAPPVVVQLHGSIGQIDHHDPRAGNELYSNLVRLLEVGILSVADELQSCSTSNTKAWQTLTRREVTYIPPAWAPLEESKARAGTYSRGLVVGRIQYWKGPSVLCEALRLLGNNAPSIDWVGRDTEYREAGMSMSKSLAKTYPDVWNTKVIPLGPKTPEEAQALQAQAKFLVVSSTWDVFNYACVEGMAQGQVVICSDGAGACSLIINGVNGFTFPSGDATALAECIKRVQCLNFAERTSISEAARDTIMSTLSPKDVAEKREAKYEKVISVGKWSSRPNSWLANAVSPREPLDKPFAFLDRLALKGLARYTLQRGLSKVS